MLINDAVISLSGIATFSDGSSAPFGANYDAKGAVYTTATTEANIIAGDQMHELTCGFDRYGENFHTIIVSMLENANIGNNADFGNAPDVQKVVTDLVFKISGIITIDNGKSIPILIMYQNGAVSDNLNAILENIEDLEGIDNESYWQSRLFYTAFEALGVVTIS